MGKCVEGNDSRRWLLLMMTGLRQLALFAHLPPLFSRHSPRHSSLVAFLGHFHPFKQTTPIQSIAFLPWNCPLSWPPAPHPAFPRHPPLPPQSLANPLALFWPIIRPSNQRQIVGPFIVRLRLTPIHPPVANRRRLVQGECPQKWSRIMGRRRSPFTF